MDINTAQRIQTAGANLSGELKTIAAGLGKEINTVSDQCSKMETTLTSIAKNTRSKLWGKMKALGEMITNGAVQIV